MTKVQSDLAALAPAMREIAECFLREAGDLPVRIFETYRDPARQDALFAQGTSRARGGASPHNHRLAFDVILDLKSPIWPVLGQLPLEAPAGDGAWDTGVVVVKDAAGKRFYRLDRPVVLEVWRGVGRAAKRAAGFDSLRPASQVWGGDWYRHGDSSATAHLGWDPGHIQHPEWKRLAGIEKA